MAQTYRANCPHCHINTLFQLDHPIQWWSWRGSDPGRFMKENASSASNRCDFGVSCPECGEPFILVLFCPKRTTGTSFLVEYYAQTGDLHKLLPLIRYRTVPVGIGHSAHESIPERIRKPFEDACEDAAKRRNAPGLMAVARGCLDVALKELGEEKGSRRERIASLRKKGLVTESIADWSNRLWQEGSDAVHDLTASMDQAVEHIDFLKLFFEVAFVLPDKVKKAEAGVLEAETPVAPA